MFSELRSKGLITIPMGNPNINTYLDSLSVIKNHGTWDTLSREKFPPEVIAKVASYLKDDPQLSPYIPYLNVQIDKCKTGYYQPPHNDTSLFSPFIAQLFITGGSKIFLLAGNTEDKAYSIQSINDGDLLFFYTYPNNLVYSFTELTEKDIYVLGFIACMSPDPYADWVFKDVKKDWPRSLK